MKKPSSTAGKKGSANHFSRKKSDCTKSLMKIKKGGTIPWPKIKLSDNAKHVKIHDLDLSNRSRCFVHGRVENRTDLTISPNKKMTSFSLILADESSEIKITLFGEVAQHWNIYIKTGTCYIISNFRLCANDHLFNYTSHKYQAILQKFSVVEECYNEKFKNMPKHLYVNAERNFFKLVARNTTLINPSEIKQYQLYDIEGLIFKIRELSFKCNNKDIPKIETWLTNGYYVVKVVILEDRVEELKTMFNEKIWSDLKQGKLEITKNLAPKFMCLFRNLALNFDQGFNLHLHSKQGEMYLKCLTPRGWIWPQQPRKALNLSETYLELPGRLEEHNQLIDIVYEADAGHYIVSATLRLEGIDVFSYSGVPNNQSGHRVTLHSNGQYFCSATKQYYDTCEEYFRFSVTLKDDDCSVQVLILDKSAKKLLGMSASELIKIKEKGIDCYDDVMRSKNGAKVLALIKSEDDIEDEIEIPKTFIIEDIQVVSEIPGNYYEEE